MQNQKEIRGRWRLINVFLISSSLITCDLLRIQGCNLRVDLTAFYQAVYHHRVRQIMA